MEPKYVAQTAEVKGHAAARKWFRTHAEKASAEGCTWFRYSRDPDTDMILIEGWEARPADEGAPRWSLNWAEDR